MNTLLALCLFPAALAETPGVGEPYPSQGAPTEEDPGTWMRAPFGEVLAAGKDRYFNGDAATALEMLETLRMRIRAGEAVEWALQVDALTYLGELYYFAGKMDLARDAFRQVLTRDPDAPISPYHHSDDVVTLFDLVRGEVVREQTTPPEPVISPPAPPDPAPGWVLLPFGVPQFIQERPAAGVAYATLQTGFGAASLALLLRLNQGNQNQQPPPYGWQDIPSGVQSERYALQWPATAAFYATWAVSAIDAARWHRRHSAAVGLSRSPTGAPLLVVGGTF